MTDELELLKKDWQKRELDVPTLSYEAIHKMIWKKSSSIVKWILIISILEFILPQLLYLLPSAQKSIEIYKNIGVSKYLYGLSIITYAVAIYFIYQFYTRFKEISVLDNAKNLMRKIIKTRKTVKKWIIFSLSSIIVFSLITAFGFYLADDLATLFPEFEDGLEKISPQKIKTTLMLTVLITGVALTLFMGCIYFALYGLLLRKLKKNYGELKKLEI